MTTLTRLNPFRATARFEPPTPFDDLFRKFAMRTGFDAEPAPEMKLDVSEEDKAFIVRAEIPGVTKEDIEIAVEGPQVSISAEVKRDKSWHDKERALYIERYYGKVYRAFTLPQEVDSGKCDARYEGGVLTLKLPKRGNGSSKRIMVS
jgi:HSP20 family protein